MRQHNDLSCANIFSVYKDMHYIRENILNVKPESRIYNILHAIIDCHMQIIRRQDFRAVDNCIGVEEFQTTSKAIMVVIYIHVYVTNEQILPPPFFIGRIQLYNPRDI